MGHLISTETARIKLFGWNGAGKTSLLYKMVLGNVVDVIPTIGFNVENFTFDNTKFVAWDVGGRGRIRALHHHYYRESDAVVYMVDAASPEDMQDAIDEFTKMVTEPELRDCVFMLLANKSDLPGALSPEEIGNRFNVQNVKQPLLVQGISVATGQGVNEAFSWLTNAIKKRKPTKWNTIKERVRNYTSFLRCSSPSEQIVE